MQKIEKIELELIEKKRIFFRDDERMYEMCIKEQKEVHGNVTDNLIKMALTIIKDVNLSLLYDSISKL